MSPVRYELDFYIPEDDILHLLPVFSPSRMSASPFKTLVLVHQITRHLISVDGNPLLSSLLSEIRHLVELFLHGTF
jgi:hypothetical protein